MTFSVTEFKSNLKKGGARSALFSVELLFPTGVTTPLTRSEFLVRSSSIPASNIGTHEVFFHGKAIRIAGDRTYDTWETTILNDEDFGINPKELLKFHKKGYDYHWDISQRVKGKNIQFVKLIPTKEDGDIVSLLLGIDTQKNHLYRLIEVGENGTVTTLTINQIKVDNSLPENFFVFNQDDYPNYYINN